MRGIQINNYVNNNISLGGRKINNQHPSQINQPMRPTPLVVNHLFNHQDVEQIIITESKSPQIKIRTKDSNHSARKKRTNTILVSDTEKNSQIKKRKQKISISMQYLKKGITSPFKDISKEQSSQDNCKQKNINISHKKMKPSMSKIQKSNSVIVNRSKSTIIRSTQKNDQIDYSSRQILKNSKTLKKKINDSNETNVNNTQNIERHKLKKIIKKQTQQLLNAKQKTQKNKSVNIDSNQVKGKKDFDKVALDLKFMKFETQKKSARTTITKSFITSEKQSKPVSARQRIIKKNLFDESETKRINDKTDRELNLKQFAGEKQTDEVDVQIYQAMNKFEKTIEKFDSKKTLAEEIKKFTKKIEKLISQKNSRQNSSDEKSQQQSFKEKKQIKKHTSNKSKDKCVINDGKQIKSQKTNSKKMKNKKNKENKEKIKKQKKKVKQQSNNVISQEKSDNNKSQPSPFDYEESDQSKYIESKIEQRDYEDHLKDDESENEIHLIENQLPEKVEERQNIKEFKDQYEDASQILDENKVKYMQFLKNLYQKQEEPKYDQRQENNKFIEDINIYLNNKIQENKNYKIFNNLLLQRKTKQNLIKFHQNDQNNKNQRKSESDSQNVEREEKIREKKYEINKLKQFRKEQDKMIQKINIQKIKRQEIKNKLTIKTNQKVSSQDIKQELQENQNLSSNIKHPLSPKYTEHYPTFIKSPKYSEIQINNILSAKQKCLASKHNKMNELIQKMYDKQLVSPKSYQYSIYQLKINFEEEYNSIDNFKSQASEILQEINNDKEEIKGIDELIRQQKWEEAKQLMKRKQNNKSSFKAFSKSKPRIFTHHQTSESQINNKNKQIQEEQGWEKVVIEQQVPKKQLNLSGDKKKKFQVVQNNICINILPTVREQIVQKQIKFRQNLSSEQSQSSSLNFEALAHQLINDIDEKHLLKSTVNNKVDQFKSEKFQQLQEQALKYCQSGHENLNQQQDYIYYKSEQNQNSLDGGPVVSSKDKCMFKLIKVQAEKHQNGFENHYEIQKKEKKSQVIQIDDDRQNLSEQGSLNQEKINEIQAIRKNKTEQKKNQQLESEVNETYENDSNSSLIELQLRRGFESNLFFIKQYCISLCEYIRQIETKKEEFKQNMKYPLSYNLFQLLEKYRRTLKGDYNNQYNSLNNDLSYCKDSKKPKAKAISQKLADQFNRSYAYLKFYNIDVSTKGREKFKMEKQTQKIFLTAILDAMNQSLDFERPGSIFGTPLPWASNQKQLKNMKFLIESKKQRNNHDSVQSAQCYDFMFGAAIARLIQWSSCLSGFLPDTAELQNTEIDQNYVTHIRQTRMAFLLQKMLSEEEATINNSEMEQTQVMLFLGRQIMEQLINEAVNEILS